MTEVIVYCGICESALDRPFPVAAFVPGYDGSDGDVADPPGSWRHDVSRRWGGGPLADGLRDYYDPESPARAARRRERNAVGGSYFFPDRIECPNCSNAVMIRRDRMFRFLTAVSGSGVHRVSLAGVRSGMR